MAGPYTRLLAQHEEATATLYSTFGALLPEGSTFWAGLSKEEWDHAALIMTIDDKLKSGEYTFRRPEFVTTTIEKSLTWIDDQKQCAETRGITMREAFKLALDLENSMIETGFFHVVDTDTPQIMDTLKSLEAYTKAHAQRLQLEAKRFKWRLMGARRSVPRAPVASPASQNVQASVKASQANMLGLLVSLEEAASSLYSAYSRRLKTSEKFWAKMAADEMQHASVIRSLYKILDKGSVFYNVGRFNQKAIQEDVTFAVNAEFEARHGKLSIHDAINTALQIERSITETGFFAIVTSDSREYQIIAKRLTECTQVHIKQIEQEAGRAIDLGETVLEDTPIPD